MTTLDGTSQPRSRLSSKLSGCLQTFEANIAKSNDFDSGNFITNVVASGRQRRASMSGGVPAGGTFRQSRRSSLSSASDHVMGAPAAAQAKGNKGMRRSSIGSTLDSETMNKTVMVNNKPVPVKDLIPGSSHHSADGASTRIRVRVKKRDDLHGATVHGAGQPSEMAAVAESLARKERSRSAPRANRETSDGGGGEQQIRQSSVQANRQLFERRSSATGANNTANAVPKSIFRRRASTTSTGYASLNEPKELSVENPPPKNPVGRFFPKRGSCGPGVSNFKKSSSPDNLEHEYDYQEVKKSWKSRSHKDKKDKHEDADASKKHHGILKRLKRHRNKNREGKPQPEIVRHMHRRGSTGKMAALEAVPGAKAKIHKHKSKSDDKKKKKKDSKEKSSSSSSSPSSSSKPSRSLIRRNSTGNTRLEEEPEVLVYWNPARARLEDPVTMPMTKDAAENLSSKMVTNAAPDMYQRCLVQRRASTGRVRLDEEDTNWLFAREDHEIADADVRGSPMKRARKKKMAKQHMKVAKDALAWALDQEAQTAKDRKSKKQIETAKEALIWVLDEADGSADEKSTKSDDKSAKSSLRRKKSVGPSVRSSKASSGAGEKSDEEAAKKTRRRMNRRGSTGAVPLEKEADSRLHRKKKMRQEHKRRKHAVKLAREGHTTLTPDAPEEAVFKPSLLALLDPSAALDDGTDDPSSWLVSGSQDHVFTIAPYKPPPPNIRPIRKMTPRELELELDGDSSDDESENDSDDGFSLLFLTKPIMGKRQKPTSDDRTVVTETDSDDDFGVQSEAPSTAAEQPKPLQTAKPQKKDKQASKSASKPPDDKQPKTKATKKKSSINTKKSSSSTPTSPTSDPTKKMFPKTLMPPQQKFQWEWKLCDDTGGTSSKSATNTTTGKKTTNSAPSEAPPEKKKKQFSDKKGKAKANTKQQKNDNDDSLISSSSSSSSIKDSFGEEQPASSDNELLKALAVISSADQTKLQEALQQLAAGENAAAQLLQGHLEKQAGGSNKKKEGRKTKNEKKATSNKG